jgi:hypothetical protein
MPGPPGTQTTQQLLGVLGGGAVGGVILAFGPSPWVGSGFAGLCLLGMLFVWRRCE